MKIELRDVSCGYGKNIVLNNVNCSVDLGDKVAVLGPNGIGKSTLFKTLLGFLPLMKGEMLLNEKRIETYDGNELARFLSYVPQAKSYSYQYTVQDMVLMGRAAYIPRFSKPNGVDIDIAHDAMEKIGIWELKGKYYSELSGGEQQCVLVARAIAQGAKFIVMDEPASNLDLKNQKKLIDVINNLSLDNIGVIMATHAPEHVFLTCNKVLLLDKNGMVKFGGVDEIMTIENIESAFEVNVDILETKRNDVIRKSICLL